MCTNKFILFCMGIVMSVSSSAWAGDDTPLYKDRTVPIEKRVDDLMSRMTLHEKVLQLQNRASGRLDEIDRIFLGESYGTTHEMSMSAYDCAVMYKELQHYMRTKTRLGIPLLTSAEGIQGIIQNNCTLFPHALAQGSTFNPELIQQMTEAAGEEAKAIGIHQILSPVFDIARELRWGRIEETYGEDPYLIAEMGVAFIKGYQKYRITCMPKHFVAHGTPSGGLNCAGVSGGERELRSLYLYPFRKAIRETSPWAVMTCYSAYDGVPVTGSSYYMTDILRGELGFKGYAYSDWGSVERTFNQLDPEDIESFTILKDASATAVYGVRGANGVILIKTKPGRVGKPQFSVDYYEGVTMLTKQVKLANAYQYMDAANEAYGNDHSGQVLYTPQYIEATKKANGLLPNDNPKMYNPYLYPAVDWMDELFRDMGHNRHANINVRGGSVNATYYASLSYYNETGLLKTTSMDEQNYNINTDYNRFNFTSNLNLKPTKRLSIDMGVNGYIAETNYPQEDSGTLYEAAMAINPVYYPTLMQNGSIPGIDGNNYNPNPYGMLTRRGYRNEYNSKIYTNLRIAHDLDFWNWSKGLSVTATLAFDTWTGRTLKYNKMESTYWYAGSKDPNTGLWNNDVFNEDGTYRLNQIYISGDDQLNYGGGDTGSDRSIYFEASLNYDRAFGLHRVGGLFLYNQKTYRNTTGGDMASTLPYNSQSIAGRATYSWNDRYFAEFNVGYNGSENFMPGRRFGVFPAFGVGWAVSNEKFWAPVQKYISYLKLRYTNGWVGSDDAGARFLYEATMGGAQDYYFGDWRSPGGWAVYTYGSNVTWSKSHKQDWGIDIKFLNDRLSVTMDYFKEHRTGIFLNRQTLPTYLGLSSLPKGNLGIVDNSGFEFQLEWNQQVNDLVSFTLRGNASWNRDKIIENDEAPKPYPWMEKRGTNVFSQWGLIADGLFTSEEEIEKHATQFGQVYIGDIKYRDLNNDKKIDSNDICRIGQGTIPKYNYGFGFDVQIGYFSVSALFQGAADVTTCLSGNSIIPFSSQAGIDNLFDNIEDRWSPDDPTNEDVFYPRLHYGNSNNSNNYRASTWWLRNMDYLRLKQFNIAYNLPENTLKSVGVKGARIYLMGTNLLTFSKFKLWDPEVYSSNGAAYPNVMSCSLGVNFSF